jgi:hypothetical protein
MAALPTPTTLPTAVQLTPTKEPSPVTPSPDDSSGLVLREQLGAAGIAFFDGSQGIVVGTGGPSEAQAVVRLTGDGGRTWGRTIKIDGGPFVAIAVAAPGRAWAFASCGEAPPGCIEGTFRSVDRGATWTRISSLVAISASFVDADHGWAVRETGEPAGSGWTDIIRTTDGGRTWTPVRNPCPTKFGKPAAVAFVDRRVGWVGCNYTVGAGGAAKGIVETVDGGHHWTVRSGASTDQGSVGSIGWSDYLTALHATEWNWHVVRAARDDGPDLVIGQDLDVWASR